jgi:hypothetical protein
MPTITKPNLYFDVVTYTGTGATQTISGLNFQPDFVWIKSRSAATDNKLTDAVRGATKGLISNSTGAETTDSTGITAFTSSGFTLGSSSVYNNSGATYVAWCWKANGSGSTNTSGSITSTVSANTTSGCSIITWTGNATQNATIGHGLGSKPAFIVVKNRSTGTSYWPVKFKTFSTSQYVYLNTTGAVASFGFFYPTEPTSSLIYLGSDADVNGNGNAMLCYAFSEISGYSAFGSYTGNGSADGVFVYTGFRPAYMIIKSTSSVDNWVIMDVARNPSNAVNFWLNSENSAAEATLVPPQFDFVSNGMKLRGTSSSSNGTGVNYIYMAFASNPFKYSLAR